MREFALSGGGLAAGLREAALLARARHPAVVPLAALFHDAARGALMLQARPAPLSLIFGRS